MSPEKAKTSTGAPTPTSSLSTTNSPTEPPTNKNVVEKLSTEASKRPTPDR
jgi:hypothetical protein